MAIASTGFSKLTIEGNVSTYEVGGDINNPTPPTPYSQTRESNSTTNVLDYNFAGDKFLYSLINHGMEYKSMLTTLAQIPAQYNVKVGISGHTEVFEFPYKEIYINGKKFYGLEGIVNIY